MRGLVVLAAVLVGGASAPQKPEPPVTVAQHAPFVIAHRGASAERPEHTLAAYRLAIEQGADFIEPDLVATKDGVLVARHDVLLAEVRLDGDGAVARDSDGRPVLKEFTTDVAEHAAFADRLAVRDLDGERVGGWFAEDFTSKELRALRARERMPQVRPQNTAFTQEAIPTFAEVLDLARAAGVGVYPELKHPTYLSTRGLDVVALFLAHDLPAPIFVQCFEIEPLLRIHQERPDLPLVQLLGSFEAAHGSFAHPWDVRWHAAQGHDLAALYGEIAEHRWQDEWGARTDYRQLAAPTSLQWMAETYATGVGVWIGTMELEREGGAPWLGAVRDLDLELHPYTVRPEDRFRPTGPSGTTLSYPDELKRLIALGATGFFVEDVAAARAAMRRTPAGP